MPSHPNIAARFLADDRGLETVEYAIISGLVVAGLLAVMVALGSWAKRRFNGLKTGVGA